MRKLCFLILYIVISNLFIKQVSAFSMDSINVKNRFGEKFNAEIPVNTDGKSGLKADIGSKADYKMMGVARSEILKELKIDVLENSGDENVQHIKISSRKIIFYPSFELIIKAELDGGTILEKYIITVDFKRNLSLSMSGETESPPESASQTDDPKLKNIEKAASTIDIKELSEPKKEETAKIPYPTPKIKKISSNRYGPIEAGETLYSIAKKINIEGFSIGQTVVALWKMNKRSFKNYNMNKLMAGTFLDYSKIDKELKKLPKNSTVKAIDNQRISWRNERLTTEANSSKLKLLPVILNDMTYLNQINNKVLEWRNAWESSKIEKMKKLYSENFSSGNANKSKWLIYKKGFNNRHSNIKIKIENIEFLKLKEHEIYATFLQSFNSNQMNSVGVKTLKFTKENNNWFISSEVWDGMITSSVGSPYVLHTASVSSIEDAVFETNRLRKLGYKSYFAFFEIPGKGLWYRIFVNRFNYKISALKLASKMIAHNHLKYALPMRLPYSVILGSFENEEGVNDVIKNINKEDINFSPFLYIKSKSSNDKFDGLSSKLLAGAFYAQSQAKFLEKKLTEKGIDYKVIMP